MPEEVQEPKTASEIQIENLQKQLDDLKATYDAQLKEYADANKGLWAELHKAPVEPDTPSIEEPKGFDLDKAVEQFNACYGIKKVS